MIARDSKIRVQRNFVRYVSTKHIVVCSVVCDHDAIMLGNGNEGKKPVTYTVQVATWNSC